MGDPNPLPLCALGRKQFWEDFYIQELENYEDYGDTGDIWFGKKNLQRIVNWLSENIIDKHLSVLDVGCGNGMTLVSLANAGFTNLTGVDFAEEGISLAKKISEDKKLNLTLEASDFLEPCNRLSALYSKTFHVIIDKGTYDAICLSSECATEKRKQYKKRILHFLSCDGYFLLFSCNWTKEELLTDFDSFSLHSEIEIPSISFGGKTGQTVTALVMKKNVS